MGGVYPQQGSFREYPLPPAGRRRPHAGVARITFRTSPWPPMLRCMVVRRTRPAAPIPTRPRRRPAKRCLDIVLSAVALTVALPVLLVVAALVKLEYRDAPVLFRQRRAGRNGRPFTIVKFRTMVPDAEQRKAELVARSEVAWPDFRLHDDPRVTRLGRFLRRTSIDELPQLVNVLRGEMSLVGPRPHAVAHDTHYAGLVGDYLGRHRVKPGVTGWAQVNGLRGETDTLEKMRARVEHDLYYVDNWSLLLDLQILLRTFLTAADQPAAR